MNMKPESLLDSVKENLNGQPGQPIVLGVCVALAKRYSKETWVFRAATIVLALFWTIPTLIAYSLAGLFMSETEERTRGVFGGLFLWLSECVEKGIEFVRNIFNPSSGRHSA
jgi:phage shock protein PspC (stress-responsive transcriptional regulator)